MEKKKMGLPMQIFLALILGIVVGLVLYFAGAAEFTTSYLKPFGDIFVNLLKFIVVPVVLFSMIDGIISMGDMKKVGSVGWKTVAYFMVTTAIACVIGLVLATLFNNAGLFPNLAEAAQSAEYEAKEYAGFMSTLVSIFPTNMWKSFTEANMLQVIVIALLFGGAIMAAGEKAKLCRDIVTSFYAVIDKLMTFVISLAPIGVFAYMSWVVATQGAAILGSLALVILCAYIGYMIHAVVVYSVSARVFAGISPWAFFKGASAAMIFAFTSTSSAATLPVSKECAAGMGAEDDIAAFVLPLGAKFASDAGIVNVSWLVISYGLQSIGELMISGLGLAMVAQLVPQRLMGFIMGSWFLTTAGANLIGGYVANMMAVPDNVTDPLMSLEVYGRVFLHIGVATGVIAILMLLTAPKLNRMTQDDDKTAKASDTATA